MKELYPWHLASAWRASSEILFRPLIPSNLDTLDLGCGYAAYRELFKGFYVGLDPDVSNYHKRETNLPFRFNRSVKKLDVFVVGAGESLPFKNESFDFILCVWTLEHVQNDFKVVKEAYRILKKASTALFVVPSIYNPLFLYEDHGERVYREEQFLKLLKDNNFKISKFQKAGGFIVRLWYELWLYSCSMILNRIINYRHNKRRRDNLDKKSKYDANDYIPYALRAPKSLFQRVYRYIRGTSLKFVVNLARKLPQVSPANYIAWVSK